MAIMAPPSAAQRHQRGNYNSSSRSSSNNNNNNNSDYRKRKHERGRVGDDKADDGDPPKGGGGGGGRNRNQRHGSGSGSRGRLPARHEEVATLVGRIAVETPPRGSVAHGGGKNAVVRFDSLPLSQATLLGLQDCGYAAMTAIQAGSIPHALAGRDILGAACTGSGKTLAFLVPLLERLYRNGYTPRDGVGAIVLSPTRELAGQIFAVLRKVGKYHSVSLGLLMGGKNKDHRGAAGGGNNNSSNSNSNNLHNDFHREQQALPTTNVLICTPGRLLQHLEQTPYFNVDGLQMLVLDEADRILDMGFRDQLLQILDYLPKGNDGGGDDDVDNNRTDQRQTLLFSATQTKDVKHLATLSINHRTVEYVGLHDQDAQVTPERLKQAYVIVPLQHKLNCLYSFLKAHLRQKTIVFFSTCSQVRHAWDLFCRLRPGLSVLGLHGKLSQAKRLEVYDKFTTTQHCVLFATDVASRGLDFPHVASVLQIDAPDSYEGYIHRVGRTARFHQHGQALLLLDPSEEAPFIHNPKFREAMGGAHIARKAVNPTRTVVVTQRAAALVAEHAPLHALAKKAFWSYVRSISLLPRDGPNAVWADLRPINEADNLEEFALSLGLPNIPGDVRAMLEGLTGRDALRKTKNVNRKLQKLKEQIRLEKEERRKAKKRARGEDTDTDEGGADEGDETRESDDEDEDDDGLLVVKARHEADHTGEDVPLSSAAPRKSKRIRIDGSNSEQNKHVVFEEDGTVQPKFLHATKESKKGDSSDSEGSDDDTSDDDGDNNKGKDSKLQSASDAYLEQVRQRLEQTKELDKHEERERIRSKHKKKRLKEKMERTGDDDGDGENVAALDSAPNMAIDEESEDGPMPTTRDEGGVDDSSEDISGSSSSESDEEDGESVNMAQQEDLALSLIRGGV